MTIETMSALALTGTCVLVIEDEFYLAMEIQESIEEAGGRVLGPFPTSADGLKAIEGEAPDCAVVDINLGNGPSFEVAEALHRRGIPFLFLTGYDAPSIPADLADVQRVEKPANIRRVIETLAQLQGE